MFGTSRWVGTLLALCLALVAAVPSAALDGDKGGVVEFAFSTPSYRLLFSDDGSTRIEVDGFSTALIPGYPELPVRIVDVALPPDARAVGVTVTQAYTESLGEGWTLARVPPQMSEEGDVLEFALDSPFPPAPVELEGTHALGGFAFARLRFYPFRYDPANGGLTLTASVSVSVQYVRANGPSLPVPADGLESLPVANAEQAIDWYPSGVRAQSAEGYLILTTQSLAGSAAVQDFVAHKRAKGFAVYVATPGDWAGYPGADNADRIRNFLIDRYGLWNLRWLLIIGSGSTIPMKVVYPSPSDHSSSWATPTDAYYADLSGQWDLDGDGYPGERGQDAADFAAELRTGRIPFDDAAVVASVLRKTIAYEQTDGDWRWSALLAMAIQDYTTSGQVRTDGAYLGEEMRSRFLDAHGVRSYRLYEATAPGSSLPFEEGLALSSMVSNWARGYGLVVWWGHGNRYAAYRKVWNGSYVGDIPFITYSDLTGLDDSKPAIVFQNSCLNAQPENTNLAAKLLERGAVATVAGTRLTWYYLYWDAYNDGGNASMAFLFGQNLIADRDTAGAAFADMRATYAADGIWTNGDQQNLVSFNLYGDPSVSLWPTNATLGQPLSEGWNLVSFSNLASPIPVDSAFASIEGSFTDVYAYNSGAGPDPWLHYTPGFADEDTLTHVDGQHGYWVRATQACTLTLSSAPADAPAIALRQGWNLVAFPKMSPQDVSSAFASIADRVLLAFAHDAESPGEWKRYSAAAPAWANKLQMLYPGQGYWIKVSSDTVWMP